MLQARTPSWSIDALKSGGFGFEKADGDAPALNLIDTTRANVAMETAVSYNCCSQTQTEGPGCCQIQPEDGWEMASRHQRLWPQAA